MFFLLKIGLYNIIANFPFYFGVQLKIFRQFCSKKKVHTRRKFLEGTASLLLIGV